MAYALCLCPISSLVMEAICCAVLCSFWKILLFLSFHKFHKMWMQTPLNLFCSCFGTFFFYNIGTLLVVCSYQVASDAGSCCSKCKLKFSQYTTWSQNAHANGHDKERCISVSKGPLHMTQHSWWGHPFFGDYLLWGFCHVTGSRHEFCIYFCFGLPDEVVLESSMGTPKLYFVCRVSGVNSVNYPFTCNGVLCLRLQLHALYSDP